MKRIATIFSLILVGCANPGIVQLSPDTYMLAREDHAGIFGSASALKTGVISDANHFAAKQGKVAIPVSSQETPVGVLGNRAKFEYQFRVVDKTDPEARRTALVPRADVIVERTENISAEIRTKDESTGKKMYIPNC